MTEEELEALRLKLIGKLARVMYAGEPYLQESGVVESVEPVEPHYVGAYRFKVRLKGLSTGMKWYINNGYWQLELHPMYGEVNRD